MASSSTPYSEELTCPICLAIFSDPVILFCGHSFCRECITLSLSSQQQCPQCRTPVPTQMGHFHLTTNHILKSLAEKAKETERLKRESGKDEVSGWFCPEHEEKLKLFCITDQQLVCIICRDGAKHEGHKFKPVKEAAVSLKAELEAFVQQVSCDNVSIEKIATTQNEEITKSKEKFQQLMTQISSQFKEMHQFLKKREDEIKEELKLKMKDEAKKMSENLETIETTLSGGTELDKKVKLVLEMTDSEKFLKSWAEENSAKTARRAFRPRGTSFKVVNSSLSLMPYESHLQFFVWKEMLQVIQPRAEQLKFTTKGPAAVSVDGRSLLSACEQCQQYQYVQQPTSHSYNSYNYDQRQTYSDNNYYRTPRKYDKHSSAFSSNKFTSGQHYWEIDVGQKTYWEIGIEKHFLKYDGSTYTVFDGNGSKGLFHGSPKKIGKIGIYLNCSSQELSFYDADTMTHIHTVTQRYASQTLSAYLKIGNYKDNYPVMACWY
ncbi:zinc-binding protein A33-like [Odontesthes bonariensis]|uniref:zinc-binding protein A33-like n=1 Tax=Odontesthes bonariensis TaxID=219752 RepID=UPI003F5866F4